MAPFKSSLARSGKKLLGLFNQSDLTLRGSTQLTKLVRPPFTASGGSTVESGGNKYHVFTSSGSFVVSESPQDGNAIYYAVVGGGGGAGNQHSAGGGAGGFRTNHPESRPGGVNTSAESAYTAKLGTYAVVIGGGGTGSTSGSNQAASAGGHSISILVAQIAEQS